LWLFSAKPEVQKKLKTHILNTFLKNKFFKNVFSAKPEVQKKLKTHILNTFFIIDHICIHDYEI
jgi:hypothetical protein